MVSSAPVYSRKGPKGILLETVVEPSSSLLCLVHRPAYCRIVAGVVAKDIGRAILLIVKLWFLAAVALARLLAGQSESRPANFTGLGGARELRLFPADRPSTAIKMPFALELVKFASDGRSLYASLLSDPFTKLERMPGLVRIDFSPVRSTTVAGTQGFGIKDFAVTPDHRKIVVSGRHREEGGVKCGLFELTTSTGAARRVLAADCNYQWSWMDLSVSPQGDRAVASYGNTHTDHNYRLDLIDLAHGATKSLGDLDRATWSPDGKWIAAIEWKRKRLILLDVNDLSHRRDLGSTIEVAWSPDSRYLLTWKFHFLKCGIGIDVDPPASLEGSRIRETIADSQFPMPTNRRSDRVGVQRFSENDRAVDAVFDYSIAWPRAACPRRRKVFGYRPSPHSLKLPKSLYQGPSGTLGCERFHCSRRARSSADRPRSMPRT
jgi:hypothetical protein